MEKTVLWDKETYPTDPVIFKHIGKNKTYWTELFDHISAEYPQFKIEWRYYNDGKSWLLKCTNKSKTIFWLSLYQKSFRVTLYFNKNYEQILEGSSISSKLKKGYKEGRAIGKIKPITILVSSSKDIVEIKKLIIVKLSIK